MDLRSLVAIVTFVGATFSSCGLLLAETEQPVATLIPFEAGQEGLMAEQGIHTYLADLEAGRWRLSTTQHGVDLVAGWTLPDGTELGPFNSPAGRRGMESFLVSVESSGIVQISLRAVSKSSQGRYSVRIEPLSGFTDQGLDAEIAATEAAKLFAAGAKEEAYRHYRRALELWPAEDRTGRAQALVSAGSLARSLHKLDDAVDLFRQALPIWRSLADRANEAVTLNRLGLTLDRMGDSLVASRHLERALVLWQELGDSSGAVPVRLNLCLIFQRQGFFESAQDCYEEGLVLLRQLGQHDRETVILSNLAGVHWKLGEPNRALELYDEVLSRSRASGHEPTEGRVLTTRALLFSDLGEVERALLDYGQALAIFRRLQDPHMEGTLLSYLGSAHLGLGELDRARVHLEQALALLQETQDRRGEAAAWRTLGEVYDRQGIEDAAFDAYGNALTMNRSLADRRGEATLLRRLGQSHAKAGNLRRAMDELKRAVELQREFGDRRQEAQALSDLGRAQHRSGGSERALALLTKAQQIFEDLSDRPEIAATLSARAGILRDLGRLPEALKAGARAVDLVEDLRTRAGGLRQRANFLSTRRSVYEIYIDLLMDGHGANPQADYAHRAFAVSERARARTLLDSMEESPVLDPDLARRLKSATRRLAAQMARQTALLQKEHEPARANEAERKVVAALTELETLRAEARQHEPGHGDGHRESTSKLLDAKQVGRLLDSETVLLQYAIGEQRSFLWVVGRASLESFELPGRQELETAARQVHADLSVIDLRTGRTSPHGATRLGRTLLSPALDHLKASRRAVVVADGALHYLPFAALPRPDTGEPLIKSHEVVHLPSASILAGQRNRSRPTTPSKTLAILADPVFHSQDPRLPQSSPPPSAPVDEASTLPGRVRSALGSFSRLPATGLEAEAISGLVPDPTQRLVALGLHAHRDRVLGGELESYRYLHFATHGLIHAPSPGLSGLVLALFDSQGRARNGFLNMEDLYGLRLSADLVVLSGCQTALGEEIHGEGFLGLSRGFMAAGVPRVVASLWPVQDEVTARLMTHFYQGILEKALPPAAALAAAQRSIREQSRWSDPYFWSAFVLLGDWR